jgi:hypothetical protein
MVALPIPPATTIDEVILRLETIIEECITTQDRMGYFAALYNRVTLAVRDGIQQGKFDNGPRMERLDVTFANRYLTAYAQFRTGELPSRSWLKAFQAAANPDLIILQHLLLGMNAHINLDLGTAAARTCPGSELAPLLGDFNRINTVLASLTPLVEQEVDSESPDLAWLSRIAPELQLKLIGLSMDEARASAWKLAQSLAPLPPQQQVPLMASRDADAVLLADVIQHDGLLIRIIRSRENSDVAANIRALAQGEFRISVPAHAVAA